MSPVSVSVAEGVEESLVKKAPFLPVNVLSFMLSLGSSWHFFRRVNLALR